MSCEFFQGCKTALFGLLPGFGGGAVPSDDVSGPGVVLLMVQKSGHHQLGW